MSATAALYREQNLHTTPPGQLKMEINPAGSEDPPTTRPARCSRTSGITSSPAMAVVEKQVWVDGQPVASWNASGPIRPGDAPLRIGAAGNRRTARTLPRRRHRHAGDLHARRSRPPRSRPGSPSKALSRPPDPSLLGCWPLDEERGDRAADSSRPHRRDATDHQPRDLDDRRPEFRRGRAAVRDVRPRQGSHAAATACGWRPTISSTADGRRRTSIRLPEDARSGIYAGRIHFTLDGEERLYHTVFIVKKAASRPKAPIAFLCSTNTWRAYAATPFRPRPGAGSRSRSATTGSPTARAIRRRSASIGRITRGRGRTSMGFRMPWPIVGPYTLMGPEEWDYSHLCRQDRFTQAWLESQGYDYDVFSDTDLHLDPQLLDGYKVLFVVGHSEYWSFEAMDAVSRFLDRGGNAIVLSGNTAFWRVSFDADATVIECRKGDAPGTQVRADRRGEMWHSHDGRRGGHVARVRVSGLAALRPRVLLARGRRHAGRRAVQGAKSRPFPVQRTDRPQAARGRSPSARHPAGHFRSRSAMRATCGSRRWRGSWSSPLLREWLNRLRTRAASRSGRRHRRLEEGQTRRPGTTSSARSARQGPADSIAAEMIYWERAGGGRVFHSGSINSGSTLTADPRWSGLLKNVLAHFGVPIS